MVLVELWLHDGLAGFVYEAPTGVTWTNQTGGCACNHPALEGVFVPIPLGWLPQPEEDPLLNEWGSVYTSARVNAFLQAGGADLSAVFEPIEKPIPVELEEAWVCVRVRKNDDPTFKNLAGQVGYITYTNSD
jgi:hypothetical protein